MSFPRPSLDRDAPAPAPDGDGGELRRLLVDRLTGGPWAVFAVGRAAVHARRLLQRRLAAETWLAEKGFRPPCIGALLAVQAAQPLSQRELSEALGVDPSDVVAVVDILEAAGYVSRDRDPADRRRHALVVTSAGEAAIERLERVMAELEDDLLAPLDRHERSALKALLVRVLAAHDAGADPG